MEYERITKNKGVGRFVKSDCITCRNHKDDKTGCDFCGGSEICDKWCCGVLYNRLAELEDKIEQGTLLELACKKGDKVYQADCVRVYELTVLGIRVFNNKFYYETQGVGFDNTAIGQSIFLTREEAEKRLKEIQK